MRDDAAVSDDQSGVDPNAAPWQLPAYPGTASAWQPVHAVRPGVLVAPEAQWRTSRVRVGFRAILAIPHLIVLYAVSVAAELVAIVAWFAALFTARVPDGIYRFLGWVVGYATRVNGYVWLLTDRWPTFGDDPYPIVTVLPGPDRLNRAAVFFRLILLFPVAILAGMLTYGFAVAGFVIWLIVLIAGRVPRPLFAALTAMLRFQTRYYAFAAMLTSTYPAGLYGDPADRDDAMPGMAVAPEDRPDFTPATPAPPWMTRAARRLVTLFLVLGILAGVGYGVLVGVGSASTFSRLRADNDLTNAYHSLDLGTAQDCSLSDQQLDCLRGLASRDATSLRAFLDQVDDIHFPADVQNDAVVLKVDTAALALDFDGLGHATSPSDYSQIVASENLTAASQRVDRDVTLLDQLLRNG